MVHDGSLVYVSQYGVLTTVAELGTFDASIVSNTVQLIFTPFANTSKVVKAVGTMLTL